MGDWAVDHNANKCPKCFTRVEKDSGCMHMTCLVCKYEWCWTCGFAYHNLIHYASFGGLACEFIGHLYFASTMVRVIGFILLTLFFPVIIYLISLLLGAVLITLTMEAIFNKCNRC